MNKSFFTISFSQGFYLFSQFLNIFLITHTFNETIVGSILVAFSIYQILLSLARFGIDQGILKFSINLRKKDEYTFTAITVSFLTNFLIVVGIVVLIFFNLYNKYILIFLLYNSISIFSYNISLYFIAVFQSNNNHKPRIFIINILEPSLKIIAILLLKFNLINGSYKDLALLYSIINLLILLICLIVLKKSNLLRYPLFVFNRSFIFFSIPFMVGVFLTTLITWADNILLSVFIEIKYVAVYNITLKLAMVGSVFLVVSNYILAPQISYYSQKNQIKKAGPKYLDATIFIAICTTIFFTLIILFGKPLLGTFSKNYESGYNLLLILTLGQLINAYFGNTYNSLIMLGKYKYFLIVSIIVLFINLILNITLINLIGIVGAAVANCVTWLILNSTFYLKLKKILSFNIFTNKKYIAIIGISIFLLLIEYFIYSKKLSIYFALILLTGYVLICVYYLFRSLIKNQFNRKKRIN